EGLLFRDEHGAWSTQWDDSTEDYTELPLPGGVVQSIERRLERLPGAMQEPLGLAAVIGRGIPFDLWQQACGLGDKELLAAAGEMCRRGLLHRVDPADPDQASRGMDYLFHHDLVRRVAYDRLAPPLLRAYHRRIADALYHLGADKPEAFAYHYTAGQAWELAARYQREAGDRAAAVYANSDALAHYEQALHALGRSPGPPDPMCIYTIHRARERIHDLLGARQEQTRELEAMEGLAGKMGDNRLRAEAAYRKARQAELMCNFPPAIEYAKWAVELSRSAGDTTTETESHMEWGWALLLQGENAGARERFEASLSLARSNDLTRLEADGLHGLGTVCLVIGEFDEGKAYFQQVLEICRKVDIRARAASTLANLGTIASAQGDHGASKMYNEQALGLCREIGDQRGAGLVIGNLASEFLAESDFSAARMYLEQALEIQLAIQALDNAGISYRDLGLLFHRLGDHPKAGEYYDRAMSVFIETGIRLYQCQTLAFQGLLAHHLGDEQRASQQCSQGLAIAREINDPIALGWLLDIQGHILADRKEYDQAIEAYQEAVTLRKETAGGHHAAESLAGLARIAMQQGDLPLASEHIGRILAFEAPPGFDGALEPMRIYLTCYRVLEACRDPRLEQVLDAAHNLLLEQKGTIQDEALETSFLANVTANREIEEAFQALQVRKHGRQATVQLPRLDAATGRP
ncbi:MAG: tetratricopeptide repeat protein, partial [Chloroflexi bacterium]|nr:tetratricopeptide repeat protein [Chloroflexota bacterium]